MSSAKIKDTRFYNRYGNKKVALLEEGQSIEIDSGMDLTTIILKMYIFVGLLIPLMNVKIMVVMKIC